MENLNEGTGEKVDFLSSNTALLLERSMGYLWTKQAAVLDNIANAETPNYKPKVVTFEESLRGKLESAAGRTHGARRAVRDVLTTEEFAVFEPQEATRMDDNAVNVTEQSVEMIRNAYQLQYVFNAISGNINTLRMAIRGQ